MPEELHKSVTDARTPKPADCVCFGLRSAARAITRIYDDALKPCELKTTQFTLLAHLARLGAVAFSELTEQLVTDQTTLTRNLRPLERRRLISVRPGQDKRTREISLTTEGRAVFERALPLWQQAQQKITLKLGESRWTEMHSDLRNLITELKN